MKKNQNLSLKELIDIIVNKYVKVSNGKLGKVKSVDKEKNLCKVEPFDGTPVLTDVQLSQGAVPKKGSTVAVMPTPLKDEKEDSWAVTTILEYDDQEIKANKSIKLAVEEGKMTFTAKDGIVIGSEDADEPAVLGNKLIEKLDEIMQLLMTHTHPSIGSPPTGLTPLDFSTIKSDDVKLK